MLQKAQFSTENCAFCMEILPFYMIFGVFVQMRPDFTNWLTKQFSFRVVLLVGYPTERAQFYTKK
jgi:hypothetical protein